MNTLNSNLLILARDIRGLTQAQLVDMVPNLNQGNYSKMEKGLLSVPSETLENIAKALSFPKSFFFKNSVKTPISSFYYRKRASMTKKQQTGIEAKLDLLRMSIDELLESVDIPEFSLPFYDATEISPSQIAIRIREFLKLHKGPVRNFVAALESAGIIVYLINTDISKFDGITVVTDKGQPVIFVNANFPNDRIRYTIAHELGHLVMHINYTPLAADRDEEKEAHEFAGEFLMPYLECRTDLQNIGYAGLSVMKGYWGVSKAMVVRRAMNIGAISAERYKNLNIELSRNGEKKREVGSVELDQPRLIPLIISMHENELGYTFDDLQHTLSLSGDDYLRFFPSSNFNRMQLVTPKNNIVEFRPKTG